MLSRSKRESVPGAEPTGDRKAQKRSEAQARQRRYAQRRPFTEKLAALEREIDTLSAQKRDADAWLASVEAYDEANRDKLKEIVAKQGDVTWRLARLEADWLEVADALQALDAE